MDENIKRFHFAIPSLRKEMLLSFNLLPPKQGYFSIICYHESDRQEIARILPSKQMMYSFKGKIFSNDCDILKFHTNSSIVTLEILAHDGAKIQKLDEIVFSSSEKNEQLTDNVSKVLEILFEPKAQYLVEHQDNYRICFPCSIYHALRLLKEDEYSLNQIMDRVFDSEHQIYGNWSLGSFGTYAITSRKWMMKIHRQFSWDEMKAEISQNKPVIVSVQGELKGAQKPFLDGHLMTVAGYDENSIQVLDSACNKNEDVLRSYLKNDFLIAWSRRNNTAFTFEKKQ